MDLAALGNCLLSPACLITQSAAGLIAGALLFLVASGLTLIFGVLGFVNFTHGSFYMLGAYFAYTAYALTGSFAAAVVAGAIGVGTVGLSLGGAPAWASNMFNGLVLLLALCVAGLKQNAGPLLGALRRRRLANAHQEPVG